MKTVLGVKPYKGARDFYPKEMALHKWIFATMTAVVEQFGYEQYNGPMLETFEVYAAKSGEELVNEQLYHFIDRGGRKVVIRPEMTPTLARMVAGRIQEIPKPIRWYSTPNLWRYERPQRGRLREHWQLNVDHLGTDSLSAEVEILDIAVSVMRALGADESMFVIYINNRHLMNDFLVYELQLTSDQIAGAARIIDKHLKINQQEFDRELQEVGLNSEQIDGLNKFLTSKIDDLKNCFSSGESESEFESKSKGLKQLQDLFARLEERGLTPYCELNLGVMRGLDYYTGTVFEIFDKHPDNNRALFGGGRYDELISLFQKTSLSGVGFGAGDVTLTHFLETHSLIPDIDPVTEVLVCFADQEVRQYGHDIANSLRKESLKVEVYLPEEDKLKKQLKYANQKNIPYVLVVGTDEMNENVVQLKDMKTSQQKKCTLQEVVSLIS